MDETEIHVKLAFANEVKIHNISLGGISLKADKRINIGKEYLLKLAYKKSEITAKGIVVWALLSNSQADSKGNVVPIYSYGLKFTNDTKEQINSFIASIEENRREADKQRGINLQADEFIDLSVQFKEALEIFAH
jgi:Tfp pilus assembly protein PilZ